MCNLPLDVTIEGLGKKEKRLLVTFIIPKSYWKKKEKKKATNYKNLLLLERKLDISENAKI